MNELLDWVATNAVAISVCTAALAALLLLLTLQEAVRAARSSAPRSQTNEFTIERDAFGVIVQGAADDLRHAVAAASEYRLAHTDQESTVKGEQGQTAEDKEQLERPSAEALARLHEAAARLRLAEEALKLDLGIVDLEKDAGGSFVPHGEKVFVTKVITRRGSMHFPSKGRIVDDARPRNARAKKYTRLVGRSAAVVSEDC